MTTIAYDGKQLCADRQVGGHMSISKIFELKDGSWLAGAGWYDQISEVHAWMNAGAKTADRPKLPDNNEDGSDILVIKPNGDAYWLTWPYLRLVKINETFASVGSGSEYALGAMAAGATAKKAVEIACRYDPSTGKGVQVVNIKPKQPKAKKSEDRKGKRVASRTRR